MTGTSKALRRLGVTGLSAAVITVGLVPLTEIAASAAQGPYPATTATTVTLSPDSDTAANGECNPFTATVSPAGSSISVNIQQAVAANTGQNAEVIGFCNPSGNNADATGGGAATYQTATQQGPGTAGTNTNDASTGTAAAGTCSNGVATGANQTDTVSCNTTYRDFNNDGTILFGVTSNTPGTMTVTAFGDQGVTPNGAKDVNEPGDTSTKTWVANPATPANTSTVTCTPTSASNPAGTQHTFTCTVKDANGNALAGQTVHFGVASGPDAGNPNNATCNTPTASGAGGTTPGQTTCQYTNNGTPGHDVINVWLETNGTPGQQTGEPNTQITKDWVLAAPNTSTISISCSPNQTGSTNPPGATAACQEPLTQGQVTLTATVQNGNPAQPVSGVIVQWGPITGGDGDETLSAPTCTTAANGTCSVTVTDTSPAEGEQYQVTATLPTQGGGNPTAQATITYHNPGPAEARNVKVTPKTATQPQGGSQDFTIAVTDRNGNPVSGACVGLNESGPGHFASGSGVGGNFVCNFAPEGSYQMVCSTLANGTCQVTVVTQSTESGAETVTATLDGRNYPGGSTGNFVECAAPAGRTFTQGTGSNGNPPGTASPNAPAGNCSDSGVVTWKASTPPPPHGRVAISLKLSCFTHAPHHVTCIAQTRPSAFAGVTVIFYNGKGKRVGSDVTGRAGKARLHLGGFKSGSKHRFQAHAKRSARTFSADSKQVTVKVA